MDEDLLWLLGLGALAWWFLKGRQAQPAGEDSAGGDSQFGVGYRLPDWLQPAELEPLDQPGGTDFGVTFRTADFRDYNMNMIDDRDERLTLAMPDRYRLVR